MCPMYIVYTGTPVWTTVTLWWLHVQMYLSFQTILHPQYFNISKWYWQLFMAILAFWNLIIQGFPRQNIAKNWEYYTVYCLFWLQDKWIHEHCLKISNLFVLRNRREFDQQYSDSKARQTNLIFSDNVHVMYITADTHVLGPSY